MTTDRGVGEAPADRVEDHSKILEVMRAAVREAVLRHKRLGNPVAVWREGRVVWLTADEIPAPSEDPGRGGA